VIYQATLRRELHQSMGLEWAPVDPSTGMAELAGVDRDTITAWSRRSTQLREWAAHNLKVVEGGSLSAAQLAAAQKATRPAKPEELAWAQLLEQWRADERGLQLDRAAFDAARAARRAAARTPFDRARIAAAAVTIDKAAFTRADLVEIVGAQVPVATERTPRELVEAAVDEIGVRLTAPRAAHHREGHERFTLDAILKEEAAVFDLVDARDNRTLLRIMDEDTAHLSADQKRAVENIGGSPWLVQPLCAPAGAGKTTSMRALRTAAQRSMHGTVLVLAPTGKAVDVAVREGAGDQGYTIAKALQLLRNSQLELGPSTLVVVDEAAMVGTADLRQLLTATTTAGTKIILVGDQHQLAPVKARGGMFAQLCTDLPWTQRLSEVWRMRDPDERAASLALRSGGPSSVRRAVGWYRTHNRLHCGDAITMAADAVAAYQADTAAGKSALLVCDTTEMTDALNQRIHRDNIEAGSPTVTGARGHRIAVGDLIISRHNDATIALRNATDQAAEPNPVRNGNRWRVAAIDATTNRLAAERLDDRARVVFEGDYVRQHITHGYAVTVHGAQGVTADTTHAVLGENTTRPMLYVAITRGRETNNAYLYQRATEQEYDLDPLPGAHLMDRGTAQHAGRLARAIIAYHDQPITAHQVAAQTPSAALPQRVRRIHDRRASTLQRRRATYQSWHADTHSFAQAMTTERERHNSRSRDHSLDAGIEM
jgi:hypothetical protein